MTQGTSFRIEWTGVREMADAIEDYGERIHQAVAAIAEYFAPVLEGYAKENAPWTDRTGNARQSLNAFTEELAEEAVALYLAHGMDYGKWLELRWAGRYAIIWPTLEAHIPEIQRVLKQVFL